MAKLKRCYKCGRAKVLTAFHTDNSRPDKKHKMCKACHRQKYLDLRAGWLEFFEQHVDLFCTKCGYDTSFAGLDFHHNDPTQKEYKISSLTNRSLNAQNKAIVLTEIEKCIVLCATCHREKHSQ